MLREPQKNALSRSVILIGLMGCGKTTVGKELSKATGLPLLDMDSVIEEQIGKSISEIFRDEGEARFRALETALLRYLVRTADVSRGPAVISTGGGVVLSPANRSMIRQLGFVVWLNVELSSLLARTARAFNRPLLKTDDRLATLRLLQQQRFPLYESAAHLRLDTTDMDVPAIVDVVYAAAARFCAASGAAPAAKGEEAKP